MVSFQMRRTEQNEAMRILRQYLRQNKVDSSLSLRVRQQVEKRLQDRAILKESDATGLMLLSSSLRAELRFDMFGRHLIKHPLFRLWHDLSRSFAQDICVSAVEVKHVPADSDLFLAGSAADVAYCQITGCLNYVQDPESSVVKDAVVKLVDPNVWLSEAALWTKWIHVGTAVAVRHSKLIAVNAEEVLRCLPKHRLIHEVSQEYSIQFHRSVISARPPWSQWPSDIHVPATSFPEIVMLMPDMMRTRIGLEAIRHVAPRFHLGVPHVMSKTRYERLKDELLQGDCAVVLNSFGEAERIVPVTALSITQNNRILVQLAEKEHDKIKVDVKLPRIKQSRDWSPSEALHQVISNKLAPLAGKVQVDSQVQENDTVRNSKRLGIQTRYRQTVFHAHLTSGDSSSKLGTPLRETRRLTRYSTISLRAPPGMVGDSPLKRPLGAADIFAFPSSQGDIFLSWLKKDEMDILQESEHEPYLMNLLSQLELDDDTQELVVGTHLRAAADSKEMWADV
uniref:Cyclic nucleotide-binding domain-containing protein n=1 Tax=Noctiluca scintillans TaxID=2966 RepID=A0A7S0ZN82_NOCSC